MSRQRFYLLLGLSSLVAMLALPLPGSPDMREFRIWTYATTTLGPTQIYGTGNHWGPDPLAVQFDGDGSVVQYPPLFMYVVAATGHLYQALFPAFPNTPMLALFVKAPAVLASLGLMLLILRGVGRRYGEDAGRLAAIAYWANPAVLLHGPFLGYLDAIMALPAVAALVLATGGSAVASGALLAVACLMKPQGIFVAPAIVLALATGPAPAWRQLRNATLAGAVTVLVVVLPIVQAGALVNMLFAMRGLANDGMISGNGANFWWLDSYAIAVIRRAFDSSLMEAFTVRTGILKMSDIMLIGRKIAGHGAGGFVLMSTTWAVLGASVLALMWRARRSVDFAVATALGAVTVHLYFVLVVQVHENHMILALPLLACLVPVDTGYRRLFYLISAIVFLNMHMFYGFDGDHLVSRHLLGAFDLSVALAAINLCALVWHVRLFARLCASRADRVAVGGPPLL